jgi:hypothetical protein
MATLSPEDAKKLKSSMGEITDSYLRVQAERDLTKEIINDLHKTYAIPKKTLNRIAKTMYKQCLMQDLQDHEEFVETYDAIANSK